jgi:hypothetical protein
MILVCRLVVEVTQAVEELQVEDQQNLLNTRQVQPYYENDFSEYILLEPM